MAINVDLSDLPRASTGDADRRDLLWMTPDDVWSLGLSSGETRTVAIAKHLQALDDDWGWVDHTWRCRIADALDDMSTRIRRHPS